MEARGRIFSQELKSRKETGIGLGFHMLGAFFPGDLVTNLELWVVCRFGDTLGRVPPALRL